MEGTNEMRDITDLGILLAILVVVCCLVGASMYQSGKKDCENEAVNRGYASFVVDSKTRTITFQWKEPNEKEIP